jgi:hypothetical protein
MLIAGATTIDTSQKAGKPDIGGFACGSEGVGTKPAGSGGWKVPPAKGFAVIEVTFGSDKLAKLAHVAAAETLGRPATPPNTRAEHDKTLMRLIMFFPPCCTSLKLRHQRDDEGGRCAPPCLQLAVEKALS